MTQSRFEDVQALIDEVIEERGRCLKVAFPLGLGKPVRLANALVERLEAGDLDSLEIFTALSLSPPRLGQNDLEQRLMEPVLDRLFGDVPPLRYADLRVANRLPENLRIHEFYYPPGSLLGSLDAQRHYKSVNFTDAFRLMKEAGLDLIGQMVTPNGDGWDLSSNTDLALDLYPKFRERDRGDRPLLVAQVNRRLPAMGGTSVVDADTFDAVVDGPDCEHDLFGTPSLPVSDVEYAIGLRVASLLKDGGTVQIGIGGPGEAVAFAAILRHEEPVLFQEVLQALEPGREERVLSRQWGGIEPFEEGLFASTEMFVEGLLHMYHRGVLTRQLDSGEVLHGAFYMGSARFYDALRELSDEDRARFSMRSVRYTNLLYGEEEKKREERRHARFINSAMMITGLGAVVSDGIDDGRVVSGVGGQYEFVTMAHALPDARSIMMVPATRTSRGQATSNLVWSYGHCTIPRHLRDIVVTEYGVADLRGKSDEEIVKALVQVCDARFQDELLESARQARKIDPAWEIPDRARKNTPQWLRESLSTYRADGTIPRCPFGSSLTEVELDLVEALQHLKSIGDDLQARRLPELSAENLARALRGSDRWEEHLQRMALHQPSSLRERALQRAVIYALKETVGD